MYLCFLVFVLSVLASVEFCLINRYVISREQVELMEKAKISVHTTPAHRSVDGCNNIIQHTNTIPYVMALCVCVCVMQPQFYKTPLLIYCLSGEGRVCFSNQNSLPMILVPNYPVEFTIQNIIMHVLLKNPYIILPHPVDMVLTMFSYWPAWQGKLIQQVQGNHWSPVCFLSPIIFFLDRLSME